MDPVQQLALAVTLPHNDFQSQVGSLAFDQRDKIVVGGVAVDFWLTAAQPTKVGSVDDVDRSHAPLLRIASLCIVAGGVIAPLLRIASLCIVAGGVMRRSSASLRSASS